MECRENGFYIILPYLALVINIKDYIDTSRQNRQITLINIAPLITKTILRRTVTSDIKIMSLKNVQPKIIPNFWIKLSNKTE